MTCILCSGINSILAVFMVQNLSLCWCNISPYKGVSLHVRLHVFGRYLTKNLSGNLRCWYSRRTTLPLHLSPPATCTAFSGKGQRVWRWAAWVSDLSGEPGLTLLTTREHSSSPGASLWPSYPFSNRGLEQYPLLITLKVSKVTPNSLQIYVEILI